MKPKHAVLTASALALLTVGIVVLQSSGTPTASDDFSAYDEAGQPSAANPEDGSAAGNPAGSGAEGAVDAPGQRVVKKMVRQPEDTLNRPGPDGFASPATPAGRIVKNTRPAEGADPGKQDNVGTLAKDDVRKGIDAVKPLVKACYEGMLDEFPDAEGKVTVGFTIIGEGGKGRVEMSELAEDGTTLFDEKMHDCMLKSIGEAEFETPSGGGTVSVRYPFMFKSDAEE